MSPRLRLPEKLQAAAVLAAVILFLALLMLLGSQLAVILTRVP